VEDETKYSVSELAIKRSEQIGQLVAALATAQTEFEPFTKDKENPYTHSRYADLESVIKATRPALAKNGLTIIQVPIENNPEQEAGAYSILAHKSGEFISTELLLPGTMKARDGATKYDAQSVGGAITYARRYTWQALVGVAAEDDDDGNSASGRGQESSSQSEPRRANPKPAPKVNSEPAQTGGRRPNEPKSTPTNPVNTPQNAQGSAQTNEKAADAPSIVPKATIPADPIPPVSETKPAESTTSPESGTGQNSGQSNKPDKSQFDAYTARAIALKQPLEKVGLKAGPGVTTGTKLKKYILAQAGVSELTDLTVGQWEAVLGILEPLVKTNPSSVVTEIDGGK
jgi:ERF superfamily